MNRYQKMVATHQKEISEFPLVYGFGNKQILRITDVPALKSMLRRHETEREAAIAGDKTGDGFIFDMVDTIMADHEFGYTQDFTDTLRALGMTVEQVNADERFLHALSKAAKEQTAFYEKTMKGN